VIAEGRHLLVDVISSVGVLIGVLLAVRTGWFVLDPILAVIVAVYIIWSGWGLLKESIGGLMDESAAPEMLAHVRSLISTHAEHALEAHDLRTRRAGRVTFIEFHLVVPGSMSVSESHGICDRIERALKGGTSDAIVTIHVEPEKEAKQDGDGGRSLQSVPVIPKAIK
jgi:cation diffusion facilitator family transporter